MLENLNPSFILELTATPRDSSNIISYVDARELKKENMVKLPVVVFNRTSRQTVIRDAIQLRGNLEKIAKDEEAAGGKYIRPIVLFQAQPRINEESGTFDKGRCGADPRENIETAIYHEECIITSQYFVCADIVS